MYYRLSCCTESGEIRGYQYREIDLNTFVAIATGQKLLGDADAQKRDDPAGNLDNQGRTMYYGHVYVVNTENHTADWVTGVDVETATSLYNTIGWDTPGA